MNSGTAGHISLVKSTQNPTGQLAVIARSVVGLYSEPDSSAELVSQAILGQPAWIAAGQGGWVYLRTCDGYHGWAEAGGVVPRSDAGAYASGHAVAMVRSLFADVFDKPGGSVLTGVVITTELEVSEVGDEWISVRLPDGVDGHVRLSDVTLLDKAASSIILPPSGEKLVATAKRFLGVPYLWGGTTPFGLDCSGFVQLVYHIHGVTLPRDASMQAEDERSDAIERKDMRAGDLLFFAGGVHGDKITHVGMAIGGGEFIHSVGGNGVIVTSIYDPHYLAIYRCARRLRCEHWEAGCPAVD